MSENPIKFITFKDLQNKTQQRNQPHNIYNYLFLDDMRTTAPKVIHSSKGSIYVFSKTYNDKALFKLYKKIEKNPFYKGVKFEIFDQAAKARDFTALYEMTFVVHKKENSFTLSIKNDLNENKRLFVIKDFEYSDDLYFSSKGKKYKMTYPIFEKGLKEKLLQYDDPIPDSIHFGTKIDALSYCTQIGEGYKFRKIINLSFSQ